MSNEIGTNANLNAESQVTNDESSDESSGETTDGEQEKKMGALQSEEIEEIRSEGSGDDMDLDETIDSQIGVRVESERQQHHPSQEEDDEEQVNILDTLPLEGLSKSIDIDRIACISRTYRESKDNFLYIVYVDGIICDVV